jgi:hypothetical protein
LIDWIVGWWREVAVEAMEEREYLYAVMVTVS